MGLLKITSYSNHNIIHAKKACKNICVGNGMGRGSTYERLPEKFQGEESSPSYRQFTERVRKTRVSSVNLANTKAIDDILSVIFMVV